MFIEEITGGITAPNGFRASGIHCGLRKNKLRRDLALICAECTCNSAGVFTTNKVFAAPVGVSRDHLSDGHARAIICNSGNANACNSDGYEKANAVCAALSKELGISVSDIIVSSTGVIGLPLPLEPIVSGIPELVSELSASPDASYNAATAIMTTDTRKKEFAYNISTDEGSFRIAGICKGSGMIEPNMATMLGFITTDADVPSSLLRSVLSDAVKDSFNMISVDGDTSTNDMVVVLSSGKANFPHISADSEFCRIFAEALQLLCHRMAKAIAADGEGATKLIECRVNGASSDTGARMLAKSVIRSSLVKAAMFGADANWGRIICSLGYSGVDFDVSGVSISFASGDCEIPVCANGLGLDFSEDDAKKILSKDSIIIKVGLRDGEYSAVSWGCDLSYEYVRINGDYRS